MGMVWLTDSQPFHLMKGASESLVGRVGIIEMLGLSNAEIEGVPFRPFSSDPEYFMSLVCKVPALGVVEVYDRISTGSLPGIRALPDDLRLGACESCLEIYIMRDIRDLFQIGDELKLRRFATACAALTSKLVTYAELACIANIDEKTAKIWLSLLVSSNLVKVVDPCANNLLKRPSKQLVLHFLDTGLAAYLTGWSSPRALEAGAMSWQVFETYAFGEIYKSFLNAGCRVSLFFFRNNDKKKIDLLLEQDGILNPVEMKKTASPSKKDARNLHVLDPYSGRRRARGPARVRAGDRMRLHPLCMVRDTFPVSERAWAFPVWAV